MEQSQPSVDTAVGKSPAETRLCQQKSASVGLTYRLEVLQLCQRSLLDYSTPPLEDSAHTAKPAAPLYGRLVFQQASLFSSYYLLVQGNFFPYEFYPLDCSACTTAVTPTCPAGVVPHFADRVSHQTCPGNRALHPLCLHHVIPTSIPIRWPRRYLPQTYDWVSLSHTVSFPRAGMKLQSQTHVNASVRCSPPSQHTHTRGLRNANSEHCLRSRAGNSLRWGQ